jgi:hypothetical protein
MESSRSLRLETVADQVFTGLECQVMGAYLDRLNQLSGKLKTLERDTTELWARIATINETLQSLRAHNRMNESLTETIERLLAAVADYEKFVRTTRSYQLAIEGLKQ